MQLTPLTQTKREAQALEVLKLIEGGSTMKNACESVGISPAQYKYWMGRSSETVDAIKQMIAEQERASIIEIIQARDEAIRKIASAVYTETNALRLMQIESHLRQLQNQIEDRHGISSMDRSAAEFMLSGPSTRVEESRTTVNIETGNVNINIAQQPEIIDATLEENDDESNDGN